MINTLKTKIIPGSININEKYKQSKVNNHSYYNDNIHKTTSRICLEITMIVMQYNQRWIQVI